MIYQLKFSNSVKKDLKRLPARTRETIINALTKIQENPLVGIPLSGYFKEYYKYRVQSSSVSYRIIYQLDNRAKTIEPLIIGSRENIYNRARRRLR